METALILQYQHLRSNIIERERKAISPLNAASNRSLKIIMVESIDVRSLYSIFCSRHMQTYNDN